MIVTKWCWMLQTLVTRVVIFFHTCSQMSLSAYELTLMFSCHATLRRLCPLGNLLISVGGLLLRPSKACSSPPTSPVPQPLLAPRPSQQRCPLLGIWDCPRAEAEYVPGQGFAFGIAEPPGDALSLSSSPCRSLWRVDLLSGMLPVSALVTIFL